jgi:hypothetical protein
MALKGHRDVQSYDITFRLEDACEEGKLVVLKSTQPSGSGLGAGVGDTAGWLSAVSGSPASGTKPFGLLLHPFEDVDETALTKRNFAKMVHVLGEPAPVMRRGWVTTNMLTGSAHAAGETAYLGADGKFTKTQVNAIAAVGQFLTAADADGYARVYVDLG